MLCPLEPSCDPHRIQARRVEAKGVADVESAYGRRQGVHESRRRCCAGWRPGQRFAGLEPRSGTRLHRLRSGEHLHGPHRERNADRRPVNAHPGGGRGDRQPRGCLIVTPGPAWHAAATRAAEGRGSTRCARPVRPATIERLPSLSWPPSERPVGLEHATGGSTGCFGCAAGCF